MRPIEFPEQTQVWAEESAPVLAAPRVHERARDDFALGTDVARTPQAPIHGAARPANSGSTYGTTMRDPVSASAEKEPQDEDEDELGLLHARRLCAPLL